MVAATGPQSLSVSATGTTGQFVAMAAPCCVLLDTQNWALAEPAFAQVVAQARQFELKYSRYISSSVISAINNSQGQPVAIDAQTYQLFKFADTMYQLSDGLFDVTTGVLRTIWQFNGAQSAIPKPAQIKAIKALIGWNKVQLTPSHITLPAGMQIDLGGIGKEYAVDAAIALLAKLLPDVAALVNYGGDVCAHGVRQDGQPWQVGVVDPLQPEQALFTIPLAQGALASSGDSHRYLVHKGVRYSHLLNPLTAWPISQIARAITVQAPTCVMAGMLSSIALLHGANCRAFITSQQVPFWMVD